MLKVEGKKFDWIGIPLGQCLEGNAMDAYYTAKVYGKLLEEIGDLKLIKLYEKLICPLTEVFLDMEYNGMLIDTVELEKLKKELLDKIEAKKTILMDTPRIPPDFKISGDNLITILYSLRKNDEKEWNVIDNTVGFGLYPFLKTDRKCPKTDDEAITKLHEQVNEEFSKRKLDEKV